jgi:hypothetical protein
MTDKNGRGRIGGVAVTAFLALLGIVGDAHAQMLNLPQDLPVIFYNSGGTASYDGTVLKVDAFSFEMLSDTFDVPITGADGVSGVGTFTIRAYVNGAGIASGGDLTVTGKIDLSSAGMGVVTGTLLTGQLKAFGYRDIAGSTQDEFEFRFSYIGGPLASLFTGNDVGVMLTVPDSTFAGTFTPFGGRAQGAAFATPPLVGPLPPPGPPVLTYSDVIAEATSPGGALVNYVVTAVDAFGDPLGLTCLPASGSLFAIGETVVNCTSAPDAFDQIGEASFKVTVQDTTAPILIGDDIEVQATSASGVKISLPITACNFLASTPDPVNPCDGLPLVVTCTGGSGSAFDPAAETQFAIGTMTVNCSATDPYLNTGALSVTVTVKDKQPPAPRDGCFIVDFREITLFYGNRVLTSSDATIRARNGLAGMFEPSLWPYRATGGTGYTRSRATLFRIYGFQPSEKDQAIPNADDVWTSYVVQYDAETKGYYIDLGGPARAIVCAEQLQEYVLTGKKGNGHKGLTTLLPLSQRNVPGIMLSHNSQIVKLPKRVRSELVQLGMDAGARGLIEYIGFQHQGDGNSAYREFVDVEITFQNDSETDRVQHYTAGFHTALNTNFESFAGCNYVDYAPGNDAVRLKNVWGPNRSKWWNYGASAACGSRELSVNQKVRANYQVAFNAIQVLSSVNSNTDTLRLFFGKISPIPEREKGSRDLKVDWLEWDRWDW